MNAQEKNAARTSRTIPPLAILVVLAVVLAGVYAAIAALSFRFGPGSEPAERPILAVLGLFGLALLGYLVAIRVALRVREGTRLLVVILLASVLIRAAMLSSWPILEIDIYRYIWDGSVILEGTSPYRYSPEQVLAVTSDGQLPHDLRQLVELRDGSPALDTILARVHYGELPTIYPPVSQAVFTFAVFVTPDSASVLAHIVVMKTVLVLFDLATVVVVIGLLRLAGKHAGWSVAYAWCPLVIKEVANTGHLDSVAVMLTTLALYFAVMPLARGARKRAGRLQTGAAAAILALAVGAKLYPIVLAPMFVVIWRRTLGWRPAIIATIAFLAVVAVVLWPMVPVETTKAPLGSPRRRPKNKCPVWTYYERGNPRELAVFRPRDVTRIVSFIALPTMLAGPIEATTTAVIRQRKTEPPRAVAVPSTGMSKPDIYFSVAPQPVADGAMPPPPADTANVTPQDPSGGLKAFLGRWEMNDFLFMLVVENLRPTAEVEPERRPWFSVVPESWKATVLSTSSRWFSVDETEAAFVVARLVTSVAFVLIAASLLWQTRRSDDPAAWLRVAFLTLAWLWLLCPTQNPWYWTWALPLVMFARSRVWLALSGLVMIYYLRFWLIDHWGEQPLLGTPYAGAAFFDFVVTWIEFGPWLLWLMTVWASHRHNSARSAVGSQEWTRTP